MPQRSAGTFACEHCGQRFEWTSSMAGGQARCVCGQAITVPAAKPAADHVGDSADAPEPTRALDYADPRLPTGSGYQQLVYPSDCATFFNPARVIDDGNILRLEPGSMLWRAILAGAGVVAFSLISRSYVMATVLTALFGIYLFDAVRLRDPTPWIAVDRRQKLILLPRAKKGIPLTNVIRLQLVSFGSVGFSPRTFSFQGKPPSGELQIVFKDGASEQTWCVVHGPRKEVVSRFLAAFNQATDVPVARVYHLVTGEWQVESFDEWSGT